MYWNEWKINFSIFQFWVMVDFLLKIHRKIDQFWVQKWQYLKNWRSENLFYIRFSTFRIFHVIKSTFPIFKNVVHEFIHLTKKSFFWWGSSPPTRSSGGAPLWPYSWNCKFSTTLLRFRRWRCWAAIRRNMLDEYLYDNHMITVIIW